jgi:UDP-glucose 4-epimerase
MSVIELFKGKVMTMRLQNCTLEGKSVLVTGGAGFIGSHLVDRIIFEKPKKLVVIDNFFLGNESNLEDGRRMFPDLQIIRLDASNLSAMQDVVSEFKTQVVFDLATIPLPTSLLYPNWTIGTIVGIASTICELARTGLIESLVHVSSSETYGSALYAPMDEMHPHNASTPYASGKSAADLIIQSYVKTFGIDATIVRPFNNFGPRQNPGSYAGIIPIVINKVNKGIPINIFGDGEQTRDFSFVTTTADLIVRIFSEEACHRDVWNIGSGVETSINSLVAKILVVMGREDYEVIHTAERLGDVRRHCADISKVKSTLNLNPIAISDEQILETIEWYFRHLR